VVEDLEDDFVDVNESDDLVPESDDIELSDTELSDPSSDEPKVDSLESDFESSLPSQTEQDLVNALSEGSDLDSLEDDFDDELLIDSDFTEPAAEPESNDKPADVSPEQLDKELASFDNELNNEAVEDLKDDLVDVNEPNNLAPEPDDMGIDSDEHLYASDDSKLDTLDSNSGNSSPSQTEQDLANALSEGTDLDSLEDDFDDELLIESDFAEPDTESDTALNTDAEIKEESAVETELGLADEKLDSVESQLDETIIDDLLDDVDDTKFEVVDADEPDDLDSGFDDSLLEQQLSDEIADGQTNVDREAEITQTESSQSSDVSSDDKLDDDFMADLTQTDFDALLNELADPEDISTTDSSEFDVDFDTLLNEDLGDDEQLIAEESIKENEPAGSTVEDELVDIDSLLEESDDAELEHEPYNDVNMDVGLSEFDALFSGENPTDVDAESGGYSAKLDLARAYIEIDDFDSALKVIEEVINKGPEEVQEEALSLKSKLK
jgi:pilus assembly protein FimV